MTDRPSRRAIVALAKKHCSHKKSGLSFCLEDKTARPHERCEVCAYAAELLAEENKKSNPKPTKGAITRAELSYRAGHWGKGGKDKPRQLAVANPFKDGPVTVIGRLVAIEYETDKLGDGMSIYVHKVTSKDATIGHVKNGRLVIGGEKIKMTLRGIVG